MDAEAAAAVMSDPFAQRAMATVSLARLAYTAADGSPRVVPIGYLWKHGAFQMFTTPRAPKVASLRRDPRAAITIDTDDFPPLVLLVRGTVTLGVEPGVPDDYLETGRRSMQPEAFEQWRSGVEGLYDEMVRLTLTPTWAKILDFETRIPTAVDELVRSKSAG